MELKQKRQHYFGLDYIITGKETNERYFLSETIIPAGDPGPPAHIHTKESESFYVLEGELTFIVNDREIRLNKGELLNIQEGEKHTWRNDSQHPAKLLITFAPAGIEGMFIELEKNMQNILEIGEKYGTRFFL